MKLLTREEFREQCLKRDRYKCIICGETQNLFVHHILERRLFDDFGYYLNNGATLCETHHILAETTDLSCSEIRNIIGIKDIVLPLDYYPDHCYDKWGNIILSDGRRMKGSLFHDTNVQKILKKSNNFKLFTNYVKYPRSYHCPWSEGITKDDRVLINCDHFNNKIVVVTEKMDGENATIYNDYYHARSIDGRNHWSRSYIKNLQARIGPELPEGWRICAENLYAKHSIKYNKLKGYVYGFSIWNENNICLSWKDTIEWFELLDLPYPNVLYYGSWDLDAIKNLYSKLDRNTVEGYVIRVVDSFPYAVFNKSLCKFVRKEHVGTNQHWFYNSVEKNELI